MPREYKFLEYKLFKQHISLYDKGACRCAVQQELEGPTVEELSSYARGPHRAAAPTFLREPPCYTDPSGMCNRPVLHNRNQQAGPKSCVTFQAFTFERLLDKQPADTNNNEDDTPTYLGADTQRTVGIPRAATAAAVAPLSCSSFATGK
ncbi:unnamed protein product [Sphagnum balticum]